MSQVERQELEEFRGFYRRYYEDDIAELAQRYPNEQRSLYVEYDDLYRFDAELAERYLNKPEDMREIAEEALRTYDLPADVSLGQAHVRMRGLPASNTIDIRNIRVVDDHIGSMVAVQGIVRKATDVRPKIVEAAFECQRCGTMTYIPQSDSGFQEPHECQGCERQGPFRINHDQSEFVDSQTIRVQESPEGLRGGETPQAIDVYLEDDVCGEVTPGDHVSVAGVLHIEQQTSGNEKTALFDLYMDGVTVTIEDEEFEDMDISDEDVAEILELADSPDIYEKMVDSVAPSIYGYEQEKLAIVLQLFGGVTKHLPDESRIRGDLHMLLIGDPGTGKCVRGDTPVTLADGSDVPIRELVETNLDDPEPVDDGVYDDADVTLPSLASDGSLTERTATRVWKREAPDEFVRVETASGRTVDVTPSHPLFVSADCGFEARRADELAEGTFVATPRQRPSGGHDELRAGYRRSKSANAARIDVPDEWTPWLARLVGYVVAEGYVDLGSDNAGSIFVTNNDRAVVDDVTDALERLDAPYSVRSPHEDKDAREVVCTAGELVSLFESIEPAILEPSAAQRVPDRLFETSDDVRRGFLRAYLEGEAHVSTEQRSITVGSMSRELLDGVRSLLLSFEIGSTLESRSDGSYRLRISGENFVQFRDTLGFVSERKQATLEAYDDTETNTNTDVVPNVGSELQRIRSQLGLSQFDCGVPRTTYQHYERGDRHPSRESLATVLDAFESRLEWLEGTRERLTDGDWELFGDVRERLNLSQNDLAAATSVSQGSISGYERGDITPDGGTTDEARAVLLEEIDDALGVANDVRSLRHLAESDVRWDRIVSLERIGHDEKWVYDLEVDGTHSYVSNGIVSHNSQLLSYTQNIAPRSVYTSGKGSSAAGLCVTGDTLVHTTDGIRRIEDIVTPDIPESVETETAVERAHDLYTYDEATGETTVASTSHVWRMPPKPCRRIETASGAQLETSRNTPVLTCGDDGPEWTPISEVEAGDHVAAPKFDDIERSSPPVDEYVEYTNEKLDLTDDSVECLRDALTEQFGTLRDAAAALDFSEDFVYDTLSNRHVPVEHLDRIVAETSADWDDIEVKQAMLRHGDSVEIPTEFGADLMYLLGLTFGDGDIALSRRGGNRGMIRISNGDEALLQRAVESIQSVFGKRVEIERQEERVSCVRLHSATVARLFDNAGMTTPKENLALDSQLTTAEHADAFLRGLMDADGSVSERDGGGSSIHFSTISEELARQVRVMLQTYGVQARVRERDRRGEFTMADGRTIESNHVQYHVEVYGSDIECYAEAIGFESEAKRAALERVAQGVTGRGDRLPIGSQLAAADVPVAGSYHNVVVRGDDPGRGRAVAMQQDLDLGEAEQLVESVTDSDLRWQEVVAAVNTGEKELYDLTVPETNNFVANGVVTHNTAAAVRDDFGDGQQWTLEAGALVLADKGIAAIDELDKMAEDDRSAMHEALEQQSISISKAGINATLKSRCSLLGAANPKYGRFDQYEPIGEQIDLEPALISRFDLIFTVTDQPDPDHDAKLADHILTTNYAGELNTQQTEMTNSEVTRQQVEDVQEEVAPVVDAELLRKYVAYSKRNCFPRMTDAARDAIQEFYVDLRSKGADEDAPVPVTARKLEATVRLAEASARVRLADEVTADDAERVIEIVRSCLQDIGVDPETGEFDADVVETGTSKSQRDRIKNLKDLLREVDEEYEDEPGAPRDQVLERADEVGMDRSKVEDEIEKLKTRGDIYFPDGDHIKVV